MFGACLVGRRPALRSGQPAPAADDLLPRSARPRVRPGLNPGRSRSSRVSSSGRRSAAASDAGNEYCFSGSPAGPGSSAAGSAWRPAGRLPSAGLCQAATLPLAQSTSSCRNWAARVSSCAAAGVLRYPAAHGPAWSGPW